MVEFVIAGPIAILLIMALIQVGLLMIARQILNEAAFEGARLGASEHAKKSEVVRAIKTRLLPFYQDGTISDPATRLIKATAAEFSDIDVNLTMPYVLRVKRLSPPDSAFNAAPSGFGIKVDDGNGNQVTAIPNDNLEFRNYSSNAGLSIQDANELRIKVVYAYKLKVPLMKAVFRAVICGLDSGVDAFGRGNIDSTVIAENLNLDCPMYYDRGYVPLTVFATVQMQSDAWKEPAW
jgi:TadE-like protein